MAHAQEDSAFCAAFRARFIEPRRASLSRLLRQAVADGLLPKHADLEIAVLALYGSPWYRLLLDEPLDAPYADRLAAVVVGGLQAASRSK